jgi:murein DD-endopeptidase MepM/ murein hydrolase activator NlpD
VVWPVHIFFSTISGYLEVNSPHSERRNSGRHLGLDIAMPEEGIIPVLCPEEATVYHSFHDRSEFNGWGGRVILELQNEFQGCKYLILGHLDKSLPKRGQQFKKGEKIAQLALLQDSGSWFRHLHVQFCSELHLKFFPLATGEIEELDGYCHDLDEDVSLLTSDPTKYLFY